MEAMQHKPVVIVVGFSFFDSEWLPNYKLVHCIQPSDICAFAKRERTNTVMIRCDSKHHFDQALTLKRENPGLAILIVANVDARKREALESRCGFVLAASNKEAYGSSLSSAVGMASG